MGPVLAVFRDFETLSLNLKDKYKLQVLQNMALRNVFVLNWMKQKFSLGSFKRGTVRLSNYYRIFLNMFALVCVGNGEALCLLNAEQVTEKVRYLISGLTVGLRIKFKGCLSEFLDVLRFS
jgi:hypothetical protein